MSEEHGDGRHGSNGKGKDGQHSTYAVKFNSFSSVQNSGSDNVRYDP